MAMAQATTISGAADGVQTPRTMEAADAGASNAKTSRATDGSKKAVDSNSHDPVSALLDTIAHPDGALNGKRKTIESETSADHNDAKKRKLGVSDTNVPESRNVSLPDRSQQLHAGIWHHVFTFLDPKSLGRLLSVNKLFKHFLDPDVLAPVSLPSSSSPCCLPPLSPNAICSASRRLFWPRMPGPLKGASELAMWRIVCSRSCQFCGLRSPLGAGPGIDPWHRGPGAKGVAPVFPFAIVCCGNCLAKESMKEVELLLSSSIPSVLIPALPMVLLTTDLHIVSPHALQKGIVPSLSSVSKIYWTRQVDSIKSEFENVKTLGQAAAEEWLKGLEARGKVARADASRWEGWYLSGGSYQISGRLPAATAFSAAGAKTPPSIPLFSAPEHGKGANMERAGRGVNIEPPSSVSKTKPSFLKNMNETVGPVKNTEPDRPMANNGLSRGIAELPKIPPIPQSSRQPGPKKRTKEEADEMQAQRRSDIERRSLLLDPPLTPDVLAHISSFQAAILLTSPLDDSAWELLKPRLLSQREAGERKAKASLARPLPAEASLEETSKQVAQNHDVIEATDKDWDEVQGPLRARISHFADEVIRKDWDDGENVGKKNSPTFAAEVLLYVRKQFYCEVANNATTAITSGQTFAADLPGRPWTQKLTLENLKWVYDTKVRPFAERHRKELFLCNGCVAHARFYGLESVIQHYAAKHTTAFSLGSVVVHWRAEWPEIPPFSPNPRAQISKQAASQFSKQAPPIKVEETHYTPAETQPVYGSGTYGSAFPVTFTPSHFHGQPNQQAFAQPDPFAAAIAAGIGATPSGPGPAYLPRPPMQSNTSLPNGEVPQYTNSHPSAHSWPVHSTYTTAIIDSEGSDLNSLQGRQDVAYRMRVDLMAKVAKETWAQLPNVNGLPDPVRVCVVIHHVAKRFQEKFSEAAPLDMFIDALSNNKLLRKLRSVQNLFCKACSSGSRTDWEEGTFSLPQLAAHFKASHVDAVHLNGFSNSLDWRIDMISLPDMSTLAELSKYFADSIDGRAGRMLALDALPWAFEPQSGHDEGNGQAHGKPTVSTSQLGSTTAQDTPSPFAPHFGNSHSTDPRSVPGLNEPQPSEHHHRPSAMLQTSKMPDLRPASEVYGALGGRGKSRSLGSHIQASYVSGEPEQVSQSLRQAVHRDEERRYAEETRLSARSRSPPVALQRTYMRDVPTTRYMTSEPERRALPQDWADHRSLHDSARTQSMMPPGYAYRPVENGYGSHAPSQLDQRPTHRAVTHDANPQHPEYGRQPRTEGPYLPASRARSTSPQQHISHPRVPVQYRERSPHRVEGQRYQSEVGYAPYHPYADHPQHHSMPPVEAYEIVEVRDPQGDYYIRRPIRREPVGVYAYEPRPAASTAEMYHRYSAVGGQGPAPSMGPGFDTRHASQRPPSRSDFEEYDPRFPTAAGGPGRVGSRPPAY